MVEAQQGRAGGLFRQLLPVNSPDTPAKTPLLRVQGVHCVDEHGTCTEFSFSGLKLRPAS